MLQSHCTVWPSRRLLRIPVAPVERNVGHPGWSGNFLSPPGVISVGPVVPGLILVSFRVKTSRKIPVLPGWSRMSSIRPGMGSVYSRRTPVVDASWSHPGRLGVLLIFLGHGLYFYISNSNADIHINTYQTSSG